MWLHLQSLYFLQLIITFNARCLRASRLLMQLLNCEDMNF